FNKGKLHHTLGHARRHFHRSAAFVDAVERGPDAIDSGFDVIAQVVSGQWQNFARFRGKAADLNTDGFGRIRQVRVHTVTAGKDCKQNWEEKTQHENALIDFRS